MNWLGEELKNLSGIVYNFRLLAHLDEFKLKKFDRDLPTTDFNTIS